MTSPDNTKVAYKTCPLCEATCGLEITLDGEKILKVRGDKDDVFSKGYFCPKGGSIDLLHNDPDRLRTPLLRKNGKLEPATWQEAFEAVEKGLLPLMEAHGRDAVGVYLGNPNSHTLAGNMFMRPMLKALGSRNIFTASTVDQIVKHVSCGLMFGGPVTVPVPDIERTNYLLILGANPFESNGSVCTAPGFPERLRQLKKRGAKLVVADPKRTRTAEIADEHIFIRPGGDAPWLMAIVNVLFAEGLADPKHLAEHINGLDELRTLAEPFTPEHVADWCGIDAATTRRIAAELAGAPSSAVYGRMGTSTQLFGSAATWLVDVVNILTGHFDRPGGNMFPAPAHLPPKPKAGGKGWSMYRWNSPLTGAREVLGEFPIASLAASIESDAPGAVKALITCAGNPSLTCPNSSRLDKAIASLDFLVCIDFYLNETARHADVVLPPTGPLSTSHYDIVFYSFAVHNIANYSPPLLPKPADEMDKWEVLLKMALILGGQGTGADHFALEEMLIRGAVDQAIAAKGSPLAGKSADELLAQLSGNPGQDRLLDLMLRTGAYGDWFGLNPDGLNLDKLKAAPHGIDLGHLRPMVPQVLRTPSAKIELAPEQLAADAGRMLEHLDKAHPPTVLIGRRHLRSNNSWMHNIEPLIKGGDRCTLQVHPADAERLGLSGGGKARISSRVGSIQLPVEISDTLMPGVVSAPHGWGHDLDGAKLSVAATNPGVNTNVLTDDELLDTVSGNCVLNGIPVEIRPA